MIKKLVFYALLSFFTLICYGNSITPPTNHFFYLGLSGGYGSTTWEGLVPSSTNQNLAINMSTPIKVTEGGEVWGVFAGYEFIPTFAIEFNYIRYPNAQISFDPISLFSFENNDLTEFTTRTETVSLMAKVMLVIPDTFIRVYSGAGAAEVHRKDLLIDEWRLSPTFGAGLNFLFGRHFMGEIGANYTAGFGESQLNPTNTYFPFLYSVTGRLAYRFN
jgi:hypothetical protein